MRTTPIGLADLVRAYRELNPAVGSYLPIANLVGLDGVIARDGEEFLPVVATQALSPPEPARIHPPDPIAQTNGGNEEKSESTPRPATYFETERIQHRPEKPKRNPVGLPIKLTEFAPPASGDMPPYIANAEQLDFESGTIRRLPIPDPLVPIAQLRSLIADLIAAPVPGDPDIERLVRDIARGHLPRVLPRKERKGAARRIHVVVDTADSMRLFQRDAGTLLSKLRQIAGPSIQSEVMTSGPPAQSHSAYSHGDTLLIVSDLSIGSRRARRARIAAWRDYATMQHTHGLRVVALVPFHYTRWPSALKHCMRLVHWHPPGLAATPATPLQLRRLARVLSLAAVIDPALLRLARMMLLPAADAGAEADFANARWTSVFNPRVIRLVSAWTVGLRSELAHDPELLELARRLLVGQRPRSGDWDRVVYEEQIVFLALQTTEESSRDLERALARVIRSLLGRLRDDTGSARWTLCFVDELPAHAQKSQAAQLLKAVASRMLSTSFDDVRRIVTEHDAKWVFDKSTEVGVLWDGVHFFIREPAHVSDRIMLVPDTSPRVVIVEGGENGRRRILRISKGGYPAWIFASPPRRLTTAAGAEYVVESLPGEWERLRQIFKLSDRISTVVSGVVQPLGYRVDIGLEALLPERELLLAYRGRTDFIGTRVSVQIVDMNEKRREITVGLADGGLEPAEEVWRELSTCFRAFEPVSGTIDVAGLTAFVVEIFGAVFVVPYFELPYDERESLSRGEMNGQDLDFRIVALDAESKEVTLTRNIEMFESWKKLLEVQINEGTLRGTLQEVVKGGFRVEIGFPMFPLAFVPTPLMGIHEDFEDLVGREYEFRIEGLNWADRWNIVLTRKDILNPSHVERFNRVSSGMQVGKIYTVKVLKVADFRVSVAIGEGFGIVRTRDMSWGYSKRPGTFSFRPGEMIEVTLIQIDRKKGNSYSRGSRPSRTKRSIAQRSITR